MAGLCILLVFTWYGHPCGLTVVVTIISKVMMTVMTTRLKTVTMAMIVMMMMMLLVVMMACFAFRATNAAILFNFTEVICSVVLWFCLGLRHWRVCFAWFCAFIDLKQS